MAYVPDMGVPAPAPTWMGGHSSIEQNPLAPLIQELLQHLLGQSRNVGGGASLTPLDPTFNMPRPNIGGPPHHPFDKGVATGPYPEPIRLLRGNFPGQERINHVFDVQRAAKQLAQQFTRSQSIRQPFLRRI